MQIKKIHIQGFKSLEDVIFEPDTGFSCLVGSNGAGKSNFCDALLFFKNIILNGVNFAIDNFGEKNLILSTLQKPIISFEFSISDSEKVTYQYFLEINILDEAITKELIRTDFLKIYERELERSIKLNSDLFNEQASKLDEMKNIRESYKKDENLKDPKIYKEYLNFVEIYLTELDKIVSLKDAISDSFKEENINLSKDKTGLSSFFADEDFFHYISNLNIFRINPLAPKIPAKLFNKSNLLMHGDNLATMLAELKKDEDKWQTLHEWLGLIVPSISEVEVKQGEFDSSLSLHFNENGKLLPAISISDGTIYTLSILTAILWNQDKNTLIVIEEPERGIHPQAITELIGFMREATTQNLNIITTTHSETLVRNCRLEELWLVDKVAGKTQLNSAKQQNPHLQEASLDKAWLMNLFNGGLPW